MGAWAVPPGDAVALADVVGRLADDRVARDRMGAVGRSFVTREFSRPIWAARYLTMLEALARRRSERQQPDTVGASQAGSEVQERRDSLAEPGLLPPLAVSQTCSVARSLPKDATSSMTPTDVPA